VLKGVHLLDREPVAAGNFGDIWKGFRQSKAIAVKSPPVYKESDIEQLKKVMRPGSQYCNDLLKTSLGFCKGSHRLEAFTTPEYFTILWSLPSRG
jgi:hypothetical protein